MTDAAIQAFIEKWARSGGAERANYVSFLNELCDVIGVPRPDPTVPEDDDNAYVFERRVVFINPDSSETYGRIDLYKRGCFVLETKQGIEKQDDELLLSDAASERKKRRLRGHGTRGTAAWNDTLLRARGQAEQYARALSGKETRSPFLMVVDVGHTIDLYAEFTQTGGTYVAYPDPQTNRIRLDQLVDPDVRERLRAVWLDPLSLDPARRSAKVTREIAEKLAELAKSFEKQKHDPHDVAQFLMRCLFTMFAEDVGLLPKHGFRDMLKALDDPAQFKPMAEDLWRQMNVGGFSAHFRKKLLQFNGGLFADPSAITIDRVQLELLIEAAAKDWKDVEPAIFGTLLERALDPVERHKLGAHYTPRAYVERLVMPTIIEPIRKDWDAVRTAAILHAQQGQRDAAVAELEAFHDKLCDTKVLDPACGSGNFLYVTLEHLKRVEGEVFSTYQSIAQRQTLLESGHTVDPHQLLGIEINPRAAAIADIVLWIGYLQWHFRTRGNVSPPEPVIKNFKNIECRDALLTWTSREPLLDENNKPVTHWDGRTTKKHPVTGQEVPDETAREISYKYNNPKKTDWPKADYVVGNPPFIGKLYLTLLLGDGYVEALRHVYENDVPGAADFVLYWWRRASILVGNSSLKASGLITTNSLRQTFNRQVVETALKSDRIHLAFVIADHPWVDSADGAGVRIAMSVVRGGQGEGILATVDSEDESSDGTVTVELTSTSGLINSSLTVGSDVTLARPLRANANIATMGPALGSRGFVLTEKDRADFIRSDGRNAQAVIKPLRNGRDLLDGPRGVYAIDVQDMPETEIRSRLPKVYQHLADTVKPERIHNRDPRLQKYWWRFRRSNELYRSILNHLPCFIVTVETAKHRLFFLEQRNVLTEHGTISFGLQDAYFLGVLSGRFHVAWALATGGTLEDRPRYNKTVCFEPFPFPDATDSQKSRIRELGEQLDAHRKRQQAQHPKLTMTGMYNVLERLRAADSVGQAVPDISHKNRQAQPDLLALTPKERKIHEQGLVSVLRQIHDDLDAAVADAYGWPADLTDEEILERLVALNHERAAEERRGIIRYLRPDFQNPTGQRQSSIPLPDREGPGENSANVQTLPITRASRPAPRNSKWPKSLSAQAAAVQTALASFTTGATAKEIAQTFGRATSQRTELIDELLETLAALGKARELSEDRFIAV